MFPKHSGQSRLAYIVSAIIAGTLMCHAVGAAETQKVLNIYNWSDYVDPAVIEAFEAKTGIKVNYDVFDSNEVLEAKMMTGASGYDVVVPTGAFLERQIQAGIYQTIDKSKLSNYGNLDTNILASIARHDPDNAHSVPWAWGTIGIGYNQDKVAERLGKDAAVDSLDLIFKPALAAKLADCGISVLDSPAEVVSVALNYLGLDPNSESAADLAQAEKLLSSVREHFVYFHSSKYIDDLANGEICVALGYNGDVLQAQAQAEEADTGTSIGYSIPREGTLMWFDLMAIPAEAPHVDAAYAFIDYMLLGQSAAGISNYVFFAVPNTAATELLDDAVSGDPNIYPPAEVMQKLFPQNSHSARFDRLLNRSWTRITTGR